MSDADVGVVGAGFAGATASLAAARHRPDAAVHLFSANRLHFGDGLLRVLRRGPNGDRPVVDPIATAGDLPADHPYSLLGSDALRDGLELFDDVTSGTYCGDGTAVNALVPTCHGRLATAARYPAAMAHGLASSEAGMRLVGFESLPDLDAPLAASRLRSARVPFDVEGVTVRLPIDGGDDPAAREIARGLDENRSIDGTPIREALIERLSPHLETADRVGVPAVLGRTQTADIHAAIGGELGVDVFEVPGPNWSVPGSRLRDQFESALADAGVTAGGDRVVADVTPASGDGFRLETEDGRSVDVTSLVLATGGLSTGGIVADRSGVREPILDCHVPHPADRTAWSQPDPAGDHQFARFGVRIDEAARPVDTRGTSEHDRLFAAGRIVGGHNVAAEGSGGGVSLATATVAGRRAAEQ